MWYRRSESAKDTLIASGGNANAAFTPEACPVSLASAGYTVLDHHDGAYTVIQSGQAEAYLWRYSQGTDDGPYLLSRKRVNFRVSGGADIREDFLRSDWIMVYDNNDHEDATEWAYSGSPPGSNGGSDDDSVGAPVSTGDLFDDDGVALGAGFGGGEGFVEFVRGDYIAHRVVYNHTP